MKARIVGNAISVDLEDLVEALDDEGRVNLARQLVADDYLFAAVLECAARGEFFTEDERGAWWFDRRRVLELRERLLPLMTEIARAAALEALRQRNEARAAEERMSKWAWSLFHAWPRDHWRGRPELPAWAPAEAPPDAEVSAIETRIAGESGDWCS